MRWSWRVKGRVSKQGYKVRAARGAGGILRGKNSGESSEVGSVPRKLVNAKC